MDNQNRTRVAAIVIAALVLLGIGGAALAQIGGDPAGTSNQVVQSETTSAEGVTETTDVEEQDPADNVDDGAVSGDDKNDGDVGERDPNYTASITVPTDNNDDVEGDTDTESEQLSGLAKITKDQAIAAALVAVPGTVKSAELENENGSVVWNVQIDTGNGIVEVKVDAGNGAVLHTESAGDEEEAEADD